MCKGLAEETSPDNAGLATRLSGVSVKAQTMQPSRQRSVHLLFNIPFRIRFADKVLR